MSYNITVEGGTSVRLPTAGKYVERDIIITAKGGADAPVTPEYTEGLAYTYDEYGKCYEVGRGDWEGAEELRIPSTYDDGVNGELPVKGLASGAFQNMTMIKRVYADSLTYSRGSSFYGCSLDYLSIKGYKMTASFEFSSSGVKEVIFGDITYIDWGTFRGCSPTCRFDFSECTQIPSLGSEDALGELTAGAKIVVPAHLKEEWKQATNWTLYADYIVVKGQENAQEKTIDITENGSYEIIPDEGKLLSKVGVNVNVGGGGGEVTPPTTPTDGKTRVYIHLEYGRTSPMLGVCPKGTVTVDWGDGTKPDTLTGTSTTTVKWTPTHEYTAPGDYVIALTVEGTMGFYGNGNTNQYSGILRYASGAITRNRAYQNAVQKVEIGEGVTSIGSHAFYYCTALASITIPGGVTSIGNDALHNCYSLASITIPEGVTSIGDSAFYNCYGIRYYDFTACTSVPALSSTNAFSGIPSDCQMLIPAALYDEWSAATNWAAYAKYMVAV